MIGDLVSLIKKTPIVSTLFCVCNFLLRTCQFIFRCFVCATLWEFYACLHVDFKSCFNAFRVKMRGWFYSTVQRDVTSVRILVHHSMDLFFSFVWWCQESIDDTFALAPQIKNGLQIESNYTCNINLLIPDFLSLSMGEATSFSNECLCHVPQIINIKLCLQPFIQIHFF